MRLTAEGTGVAVDAFDYFVGHVLLEAQNVEVG